MPNSKKPKRGWEEYFQDKVVKSSLLNSRKEIKIPRGFRGSIKLNLSSPLQRNFLFICLALLVAFLLWKYPEWQEMIIYTVIFTVFGFGLLCGIKDSFYFELESHRLKRDAKFINQNKDGLSRREFQLHIKERKNSDIPDLVYNFRSRLFRMHYQNILRTFEQGDRGSWVEQNHSLLEIQAKMSEGTMKALWTVIEVLPQLGLIGTLAGLIKMLQSFGVGNAETSTLMQGFALALGTTILANLMMLVLRPVFMQNERSMNLIISTLQALVAIYILPTQNRVMRKNNQPNPTTQNFQPPSVANKTMPTILADKTMEPQNENQAKETLGKIQNLLGNTKNQSVNKNNNAVIEKIRKALETEDNPPA